MAFRLARAGKSVLRTTRSQSQYSAAGFRRTSTRKITGEAFSGSRTQSQTSSNPHLRLLAAISISSALAVSWNISTAHAEAPPNQPENPTSTSSTLPLSSSPKPEYDLSPSNLLAAQSELLSLLGEPNIDTRPGVRLSHSSTEWSPAPNPTDIPSIVVYPSTTEEVSAIAKICHRRRIPMIAYSGGTSLEGTLAAQNHEVCLDFRRMNQVLEVREGDMDVTVQPAVGYVELNEVLEGRDMFFPPDPGPGAQIGGMISQGCSGTNAYRYGTVKDWVLGLEVVLADGTVINTRARPRKSSSGYDLTRLFTGSEGTLGFITKAHLKVTSRPKNLRVAVAQFRDMADAVKMAVKVVQSGHQLEAMELIDEVGMKVVNLGGYCATEWDEVPTIFFKLAGPTPEAVDSMAVSVDEFAKKCNSTFFRTAQNDEESAEIWEARKTFLWSAAALKNDPTDQMLSADACVPISRVGDIVLKTKERVEKSGMTGAFIGHVGDGNVHTLVVYSADKRKEARDIITEVQKMSVELDGTVSGEHGIGLEFRDQMVYELGEDTVDAMRRIKHALDPLFLLNPGKMIRLKEEDDK